MTNVLPFSLDALQPAPQDDLQLRLLNNALAQFCDELEQDDQTIDAEGNLITREVVWKYGSFRFRAKMLTFNQDTSIGQFDFASDGDWQRLTTPRALAEKLTQARAREELV